MSVITTNSTHVPRRGKVPVLIGGLALAVGLPVLAFFVVRHIATAQKIAALSALGGNEWSWREYAIGFLISPVIVPLLWCAIAACFAASRAPQRVRTLAGLFLATVVVWAVALAVRIATL